MQPPQRLSRLQIGLLVLALALIALSVWRLEAPRREMAIVDFSVGSTPATLYAEPGAAGPIVVIAHGFAGSRQMMEAYALTLAAAGYRVAAFDFEGHGRNPVPMSGDVTAVDGTTALLVDETRRVLKAARRQLGGTGKAALIGHSMASDIVVRASLGDPDIEAIVAISMYSEAVTARQPVNLLIVTGAGEPGLRGVALEALRQVDPEAEEGDTVRDGDLVRRAVVAPWVEHVGVLQSRTGLAETVAWLDTAFGIERDAPPVLIQPGPWLLLLLAGIVLLAGPLSRLLPADSAGQVEARLSTRRFWAAVGVPMVATPVLLWPVPTGFLPVLVADYLGLHMLLYGLLQGALLWRWEVRPRMAGWIGAVLLTAYCVGVFGVALDLYGASFMPHPDRVLVIAAMAVGAVPFMTADALLLQRPGVSVWFRFAARVGFLVSLGLAVALDFEDLFFIMLVLPVILLFFLVFGTLGRWVARRQGATAVGIALGLVLAWSIGVSFPMFQG